MRRPAGVAGHAAARLDPLRHRGCVTRAVGRARGSRYPELTYAGQSYSRYAGEAVDRGLGADRVGEDLVGQRWHPDPTVRRERRRRRGCRRHRRPQAASRSPGRAPYRRRIHPRPWVRPKSTRGGASGPARAGPDAGAAAEGPQGLTDMPVALQSRAPAIPAHPRAPASEPARCRAAALDTGPPL